MGTNAGHDCVSAMDEYCSVCVEVELATLRARVEELERDRDEWKACANADKVQREQAERQRDRLAEALREEAKEWRATHEWSRCTLDDDPEESGFSRRADRIDALLAEITNPKEKTDEPK